MKELPKTYDPKAVEDAIYQMWLDGLYMAGPFCVVPEVRLLHHAVKLCDPLLFAGEVKVNPSLPRERRSAPEGQF